MYLNGSVEGNPYMQGYSNSLITDYMRIKFPCIYEQVVKIKERQQCVYDVLVKIESNFIFRVVGELYKKYESIKLLTVHDSIYTTESDFEKLENEWNLQFQELIAELPTEELAVLDNQSEQKLVEIEELDFDKYDEIEVCTGYNSQRNMYNDFLDDDEDNFYD